MPVAMPTWRNVVLAPEAMPLRSGGTTAMAEEASTGLTMPMPMPATMKPGEQHRPARRRGGGHEQAADGDEQQAGTQQVAGVDADGQLAGDRGDDEGQHGDRQEAHPGGQRAVAEVVLDVQGQVQEQGEDRGREGEGRHRDADHGGTPEQRQVEHRVLLPPLGDQEHGHQHDRTDEQAHDLWARQPSSLPRTRAKTSMNSAAEKVMKPIQSIRRVLGSRDSWTLARVTMMATMPIGTLTKKIQRHPMPLVIAPPTSGPTATAAADHGPVDAEGRAPLLAPEGRAMRASEVANMMAPPDPLDAPGPG